MSPKKSWFSELAFGPDADLLDSVKYESHQNALAFTKSVLHEPKGMGLLLGPTLSGKSTIARELADQLSNSAAVAYVDGIRQNARSFLGEILMQFGCATESDSFDEHLESIGIFAERQMRSNQPPVLIVDNADRMYPSALRCLNALAELNANKRFAMRMILVGQERLRVLLNSGGLLHLMERVAGEFHLQPMTMPEAMAYLHMRLKACGVTPPDSVFPVNVCDHLHSKSGGWPGQLNRLAVDAIERAAGLPVTLADLGETELPELPDAGPELVPESEQSDDLIAPEAIQTPSDVDTLLEAPTLTLTRDGEVVATYTLRDRKVLIGRSDLADIVVADQFVSKMHALMLLFSDALLLLDLNSANGLTVNSTIVRSTILRSDDVIVLGNHRLKVEHAPAISEEMEKVLRSGDTVRMKSLIRRGNAGQALLQVVDS